MTEKAEHRSPKAIKLPDVIFGGGRVGDKRKSDPNQESLRTHREAQDREYGPPKPSPRT